MIDTFLSIGASFDWISPLASLVGDAINGPHHTFLIPRTGCPLSGHDISQLLSKRGVKTWGKMVVSGTFMISVKLGQARYAQHLLEQAGVPIENPVAEQARQSRPKRKERAGSPFAVFDEVFKK